MTYHKPLTPELRKDIDKSFDSMIAELKACDSQNSHNNFLDAQIYALELSKQLIRNLPNGYPIFINKD